MVDSFLEKDELQLARALKVVLVHFAFKAFNNFLHVINILIVNLSGVKGQHFGKNYAFNLLWWDAFGVPSADFRGVLIKPFSIGFISESVSKDSLKFMGPEWEHFLAGICVIDAALEDALENFADVSQVEHVVELGWDWEELFLDGFVFLEKEQVLYLLLLVLLSENIHL